MKIFYYTFLWYILYIIYGMYIYCYKKCQVHKHLETEKYIIIYSVFKFKFITITNINWFNLGLKNKCII